MAIEPLITARARAQRRLVSGTLVVGHVDDDFPGFLSAWAWSPWSALRRGTAGIGLICDDTGFLTTD